MALSACFGGRAGPGPVPSAMRLGSWTRGTGPHRSTRWVCAGVLPNSLLCCERSVEDRDSKTANVNEPRIRLQSFQAFIFILQKLEFGLESPVGSNGSTK